MLAWFIGSLTAYLLDPLTWFTVTVTSILLSKKRFIYRFLISSAIGIFTVFFIVDMVETNINLPHLISPIIIAAVVNYFLLKWKNRNE